MGNLYENQKCLGRHLLRPKPCKNRRLLRNPGIRNQKAGENSHHITAYSNWFWVSFVDIGKDERIKSVKEVDLKDKRQDQPSGNREFTIHDPGGYNLVIFKRK
jgi:hypothetical protein